MLSDGLLYALLELGYQGQPIREKRRKIHAMNQPINLKDVIRAVRDLILPAIAGRGFPLVVLTLACIALAPPVKAQCGFCDNKGDTAEGRGALSSLTSGSHNTAIGT